MAEVAIRTRDHDDSYMDAYWNDIYYAIRRVAEERGIELPE